MHSMNTAKQIKAAWFTAIAERRAVVYTRAGETTHCVAYDHPIDAKNECFDNGARLVVARVLPVTIVGKPVAEVARFTE
jgi:hypothetical protein